jgi:hypothetical protein
MKFSPLFVLASNLLVASLVWFYVDTKPAVEPDPIKEETIVDVKPPQKHNVLEYQSMRNCSPCIKFKNAKIIEELEKNGWKVVKVEKISRYSPTFRVWINGKYKQWTGYGSKKSFYSKLRKYKEDLLSGN